VPWVIVQPSLVFGVGGESAALFTRLAALPMIPVPGDGTQQVQPVHIDDLVAGILRLIASSEHDRRRVAAVGPHAVSLRAFLAALRSALGLGRARFLQVPMALVQIAAAAGGRMKGSLLDSESLGMLVRGNVAPAGPFSEVLGRAPRPLDRFIEPQAAHALAN